MKTTHKVISYEELKEKHPEIAKTEGMQAGQKFMYFPGNAVFEKGLESKHLKGGKRGDYSGIIVMGNLEVNGNIINFIVNYILVVLGDVYADNLIANGAMIHLKKNAYIKQLCFAQFYYGFLEINTLHAQILISKGHATSIKNLSDVDYVFKSKGDYPAYGGLNNNEYYLEKFTEIFKEEDWIEKDEIDWIDGEAIFSYFISEYEFIRSQFREQDNTNNIDDIIETVRASLGKEKQEEAVLLKQGIASIEQIAQTMRRGMISQYEKYIDDIPDKTNVKIYSGNKEIEGDLNLDKANFAKDNIGAVYVNGDLKVQGSIYNTFSKEGVRLFVVGDVHCNNFAIYASAVFINRDLFVEKVLYCCRPREDDIDSKLNVREIVNSNLNIFESGFDLECPRGSNTKNVFWGDSKYIREQDFAIEQLKDILHDKYWSEEEDTLDDKKLFQAIINNDELLKQGLSDATKVLAEKTKQKQEEKTDAIGGITKIVERIKVFLDEHSIYYQQEEGKLVIREHPCRRFIITHKPILYYLHVGMSANRDYGEQKLSQFKKDIIYFLEKYLRNQTELRDYTKGNKLLGDVFWVLENDEWTTALDDKNIYPSVSKMKNIEIDTHNTSFKIDENEISKLIDELKQY